VIVASRNALLVAVLSYEYIRPSSRVLERIHHGKWCQVPFTRGFNSSSNAPRLNQRMKFSPPSLFTRILTFPHRASIYTHTPKTRAAVQHITTSEQSHKMSTQSQLPPTFSSNYDPETGAKELAPLLHSNGGKWTLIESGKGVERSFKFKSFKKTWVSTC